jgi:hypothetical protein
VGFVCVILESPFANRDIFLFERNQRYLALAMLDCLKKGEAPFASHGLYPQCLDDNIPEQRELGIQAGFAWRTVAVKTVVYQDLGISRGMEYGIAHSKELKIPIEYRSLPGWAVPVD